MKMIGFIVFLLVGTVFATDTCPLHAVDADSFLESAAARLTSGPGSEACPMFESTTCCTEQGFQQRAAMQTGVDR